MSVRDFEQMECPSHMRGVSEEWGRLLDAWPTLTSIYETEVKPWFASTAEVRANLLEQVKQIKNLRKHERDLRVHLEVLRLGREKTSNFYQVLLGKTPWTGSMQVSRLMETDDPVVPFVAPPPIKTVYTAKRRKLDQKYLHRSASAMLNLANKTAREKRTYMKNKGSFAASIRAKMPASELWFAAILQEHRIHPFKTDMKRGYKWNMPVGLYIVDFLFEKLKVAIEVDEPSHDNDKNFTRDRVKDEYLAGQGYTVIRLRWKDNERAEEICKLIRALNQPGVKNSRVLIKSYFSDKVYNLV